MKLVEINAGFQSDVGAPDPVVISDGNSVVVAFLLVDDENPEPGGIGQPVVAVRFRHAVEHKFGGPGSEAIHGHPYYKQGLRSFAFYELRDSDMIARLKAIDKLHDRYDSGKWANRKHFILTFHDNMFECVADSFEIIKDGRSLYEKILALLR